MHPDWLFVLRTAGILAACMGAGIGFHYVVFRSIGILTKKQPTILFLNGSLLKHARAPLRLLLPLVLINAVVPFAIEGLSARAVTIIGDLLYILLVSGTAWLFIRLVTVLQEVLESKYRTETDENFTGRKVRTQVDIVRRLLIVLIVVVAVASILLHYDGFRELGTGLLASAGVAGIVMGFAAQRTLGNLLAGIQIALTQPVRVDDVVVVEGEWGTVEEITLTYVVVRLWDMRRLVLPISHFIEKPFQNWTRTSTRILGTVYLYVDYSVPVDILRMEVKRILDTSRHWDGQVWNLQVTDIKESTLELRVLVSARNAGESWDLRCEVREKLITFIQREYPDVLPRVRATPIEQKDQRQALTLDLVPALLDGRP